MKARKTRRTWLWASGLIFAAGYFGIVLARSAGYAQRAPAIGTALVTALVIPFAARSARVIRGAAWGAILGLAGAVGICAASIDMTKRISAEVLQLDVAITVITTMIACTVAGAVFAMLAERRRKLLAREAD